MLRVIDRQKEGRRDRHIHTVGQKDRHFREIDRWIAKHTYRRLNRLIDRYIDDTE